jgi:hypothetical protein
VSFKGRGWRELAAVRHVKFLKDNQTSVTNRRRQFADSTDGIWVVHKNEAAHDRVKWPVKLHICRIALEEFPIASVTRVRACGCPLHGCGRAVCTDDLAAFPDEVCGQKGYVTSAATHIKNAHACTNAGLLQ